MGRHYSLLVRAPDPRSKGCEFESRQERRENFLLQSQLCVLTLIRCPFHPRVTAVARKRPRPFCQSAGGRLHLNMRTPLTQRSRSGLTMPLSRHRVGANPERSSHATCQGTFGHSHLSSLSHCGLILAIKCGISVRELIATFKKKTLARIECASSLPKSSQAKEKPPPQPYSSINISPLNVVPSTLTL